MLVGTSDAAEWAIRFYRRYGFELVSPNHKTVLLKTYSILVLPVGRYFVAVYKIC
jgi:hypothetical protein